MTKKQLNKKKISIKLVPGDSAVVLAYSTLLHIAETYDYLANEQNNQEHRNQFYEIADSIRLQANQNYFEGSEFEDDYNW